MKAAPGLPPQEMFGRCSAVPLFSGASVQLSIKAGSRAAVRFCRSSASRSKAPIHNRTANPGSIRKPTPVSVDQASSPAKPCSRPGFSQPEAVECRYSQDNHRRDLGRHWTEDAVFEPAEASTSKVRRFARPEADERIRALDVRTESKTRIAGPWNQMTLTKSWRLSSWLSER
jgi:hypothetical protein